MIHKKNIKKEKINLLANIYLYLFLITMPFFIISIGGYIPTTPILVSIIAFIYSIISSLIAIFNYNRLKKLNEDKLIKKTALQKKGLLVVFLYFFTTIFQAFPLLIITAIFGNLSFLFKIIYLTIYEILQVSLIIFILKEEIKIGLIDLKNNYKSYFDKCLKYYFTALIIMMISNLIINSINSGSIAGNEQNVREILSKAPFYMFFSAVFIAPLLEELTFRQGIRNIFSNDKLFIIVSGLVFGGLHILGNINNLIDLLYIIPYSVPGFAFAYMLVKTKNILVPTCFHFFHNGVTMTLQILLMIIGM